MKCIVTGKETNDKTKNIPLSKDGRKILDEILVAHNDKIFEVYKEKSNEANGGLDLDEKTLRHFAPSINKRKALDLLVQEEKDIIETRDEVLDEA